MAWEGDRIRRYWLAQALTFRAAGSVASSFGSLGSANTTFRERSCAQAMVGAEGLGGPAMAMTAGAPMTACLGLWLGAIIIIIWAAGAA